MPTRAKQHILEDLSRTKFQLILPETWVFRNKSQDYGIDCEVELFDGKGKPQGLLFYVQLKATALKENGKIFNVDDLKVETLQYYKQLPIPVLLARYSKHLDTFFVKWVNNIDLTFAKNNAKCFRIKIAQNAGWTEKTRRQIENDLTNAKILSSGSFNFPLSYSINFNEEEIQGLSNSQFLIRLRNQLNKYSDFLRFKNRGENYLINISIEKNTLSVQPSILTGVFFHNLDKRPRENFIENLSLDILLALARCMITLGQIDRCGTIIFENGLTNRLVAKEEVLLDILPALLSSSYFTSTLKLINDALNSNNNEIILIYTLEEILSQSKTANRNKIDSIESFFQSRMKQAKKLNSTNSIATWHYTLGNFYQNQNNYYKSIHHYVKAKKYDKSYLERSYYYQEVAGLCFIVKKFKFASRFYEKAIELGSPHETNALFADALMFAGKYDEANQVFKEYISKTKKPVEEFLLKSLLLDKIIVNQKIKTQNRASNKANLYADINHLGSKTKQQLLHLKKAFNMDLLCNLAWFNFGQLQIKQNNFTDAMYCFTMAGITNLQDVEAWILAFLAFLKSNAKSTDIGALIFKVAYKHNKDNFWIKLVTTLEEQGHYNIFPLIDKILVNNNGNSSPTIRFFHH